MANFTARAGILWDMIWYVIVERLTLSACFDGKSANGGILTQLLLLSSYLFSNMRDNPMNIGDFNDLACFNSFNSSA